MTKRREIVDTLLDEIRSGAYDSYGSFPSERQLMERFGTARGTVRSVLDELGNAGLLLRRRGSGTFVKRSAAAIVSKVFAIVSQDGTYSFYSRITSGIVKGIKARYGEAPTITMDLGEGEVNARRRIARTEEFFRLCVREKVSGVFFQPLQFVKDGERINRRLLSVLERARIPVVLFDSDIVPPPRRSEYDLAASDGVSAGYELARRLIEAGSKRIVFVSKPDPAMTALGREQGVERAVREAGLRWGASNLVFLDPFSRREVERALCGSRRPDGIVAMTDSVALPIRDCLERAGALRGVRLVCFDGEPDDKGFTLPSMIQDCESIGRSAAALMLSRLDNPELPPRQLLLSMSLRAMGLSAAR